MDADSLLLRSALVLVLVLVLVSGCGREESLGPPEIRLGDAVCVECDMIISDERFATALLVEGDRGPEPLLFDDIGDMLQHESTHPDLQIVRRYVHDHGTREWVEAEKAIYLHSDDLHTPMASGIASFATREPAEVMRKEVGGKILRYEELPRD